jgi:prephenate dehydrogenase
MAVQVTIVGLGQIGTSIGLALAGHRELVHRVGHDRELGIARRAEKMGALDRVMINLPAAVREADLILLSLPLDQIRETLALIASDLKDGAVVMETGPAKEAVAGWAAGLLPAGRHYIGLTPVLNPVYLHEVDAGVEAAHPDLFRGGLMAIVSPPGAASEAIKLAADLTRLLGANPLFADPLEIDGLMAATHTLPQLVSAALLNATVDQPGWQEGRKVAGRAYAEVTSPIIQTGAAETLRSSAILNRENVVRVLDSLIAILHSMRHEIEQEDAAAVDERLGRARRGRELWWKQRLSADWMGEESRPADTPNASEWFGRLLGIRGRKDKT